MTELVLTDGSWVLLGVMLLLLAGVVYGFYTRGGSGIEHHPTDGRGGARGAQAQPDASGREGEGSPLSTHGTK